MEEEGTAVVETAAETEEAATAAAAMEAEAAAMEAETGVEAEVEAEAETAHRSTRRWPVSKARTAAPSTPSAGALARRAARRATTSSPRVALTTRSVCCALRSVAAPVPTRGRRQRCDCSRPRRLRTRLT